MFKHIAKVILILFIFVPSISLAEGIAKCVGEFQGVFKQPYKEINKDEPAKIKLDVLVLRRNCLGEECKNSHEFKYFAQGTVDYFHKENYISSAKIVNSSVFNKVERGPDILFFTSLDPSDASPERTSITLSGNSNVLSEGAFPVNTNLWNQLNSTRDFQVKTLKEEISIAIKDFKGNCIVPSTSACSTNLIDNNGRHNVTMYGATASPGDDDTRAIKEAIACAEEANDYATVYFPPGTYEVSEKIEIDKHINLAGAGRASVIAQLNADETLFHFAGAYSHAT